MRGPWALLLPLAACGGGSTAPRPVSNATPIGAASSPVRCELEAGHETRHDLSPPQVYEAATRFFRRYTTPGGPHDLGEELNAERDTLVFDSTSDRRNPRDTQALIDEMAVRWPDSVKIPLTRPLRADECYDEVYLDLTEDGRYLVLVELSTSTPMYMWKQYYRP